MQQTIDQTVTTKINTTSRRAGQMARKWDLYGVLALIASGAAYSVFALAHLV